MKFNEKIVKLRKIKGLTQDEFASAVGVSRQAVYKWESGQSYPEVPKLLEMKLLFGISLDDLLDENYEVILPEKPKRRSRKTTENTVANETAEVKEEPVFVEETITPPEEEAVPAAIEAAPAADMTEAKEDISSENKEEPKRRGFFARLFGG